MKQTLRLFLIGLRQIRRDGMLVCITPMFMAMVSAFLLLEERDEGVSAAYRITPAADYAYLAARIGIPMGCTFLITLLVVGVFQISGLSGLTILSSALVSALTGICLAMMVVSIAENRVEGLAVSKLMGVSFLGLLLVWFVPAPYSWFSAFLPSFWIGRLVAEGAGPLSFLGGIGCSLLWIACFTRRFFRRIG